MFNGIQQQYERAEGLIREKQPHNIERFKKSLAEKANEIAKLLSYVEKSVSEDINNK